MRLDVRIPLGLMFVLIGLILGIYGAFGGRAGARTSGDAANLLCGIALVVFGGVCLLLAWRARRHPRARPKQPPQDKPGARGVSE